MASCPRSEIVNPDEVGIYHCWNCCVRQLYLLGANEETGENHGHRLDWVHRIEETLAGLFAIEIGFHATLDNHLHLVLRNRPDVVRVWSDEEVVRRWLKIATLKRTGREVAEEPSEKRMKIGAGETRSELPRYGAVWLMSRGSWVRFPKTCRVASIARMANVVRFGRTATRPKCWRTKRAC